MVSKIQFGEKSNSTDEISSSDEEERWRESKRKPEDLPSEYWSIQKLIKYIKAGNPTATNDCLCCLRDFELQIQINQLAILNIGGLEVLVNLLRSNDLNCRLGTLYILGKITNNIDIRRYVIDLNAIDLLVKLLEEPAIDIKALTANVLANLSKVRLGRKLIRNFKSIPTIIDLMECNLNWLQRPIEQLTSIQLEELNLSIAGSRAIASLICSRRNANIATKYGLIRIVSRLLKTIHLDLIHPIMSICQLYASESSFQLAVQTEMMINDIIFHLHSSNVNILTQTCMTIFKCAHDTKTANLVHRAKGIVLIVKIIKETKYWSNDSLLEAVTGAVYKCAMLRENAIEFNNLNTLPILMDLLSTSESANISDNILSHICGAISEFLKIDNKVKVFCLSPVLRITINLLNLSHEPLLENVSNLLAECAKHPEYATKLDEMDATRLLWSLLKNKKSKVKASASWALCEYIKNDGNSGEVIRSFVGALELVANLLKSNDNLVLTATCALIANIANDEYNLAILTDYNVIPMLAKLVNTTDEPLQEHLSAAIASCATYGTNTQDLGALRTVTPIVSFLAGTNPNVHRTAAMALEKLSIDPFNCVTMHQNGVVPFLLEGVGSRDPILQNASANCLENIRKLALDAEIMLLI